MSSLRTQRPPQKNWISPYVVPGRATEVYDIRRKRIGVSFHERHPQEKKHVMTRLFSEQKQLNAALLRQSRLLKVDVTEVRSAEADRLQEVNQDILDASLSGTGIKNTLPVRDLTLAQVIHRSLWSYSVMGNHNFGKAEVKEPRQIPRSQKSVRWKRKQDPPEQPLRHIWRRPSLEECFTLRGPLARDFARAVERGYQGPPSRWLRGPRAVRLIEALRIRGFAPESLEPRVTSPGTPLFYVVNDHSGIGNHSLTHGFRGERIRRQPTNIVNLARQARTVKRLSRKELDSRCGSSHCWPTYPTLNESWAILCRVLDPRRRISQPSGLTRRLIKISSRQVTPASAAHAISNHLIGFRGDILAPKYVLRHCAYRWGFLILRRHSSLPANVVRWLTRLWKTDFTAVWLRSPLRFRDALKWIPDIRFYRMSGFELAPSAPLGRRRERVRRSRNRRKLADSGNPPSAAPSSDNSDGGVRLY
jgi:hypothetical protein